MNKQMEATSVIQHTPVSDPGDDFLIINKSDLYPDAVSFLWLFILLVDCFS